MNRRLGKVAILGLVLASLACGKRGEPLAPLSRTPQTVTEFRVAQRGSALELSLVTPRVTTGGERLSVMDVEFLYAPAGGDFVKSAEKLVKRAAPGERLVEALPLPTSGTTMRFSARVKARGEMSGLAPVAVLLIQVPPVPPTGLLARLQPTGVALAWTPAPLPSPSPSPTPTASPSPGPSPSSAPTPKPVIGGTLVYRREPQGTYGRSLQPAPLPPSQPTFEDQGVKAGESWCYAVRTAVSTEPLVESPGSEEVCIQVRDVFPPAPPTGVAVLSRDAALEVSWSPSPEDDLALYRIHRALKGGAPEPVGEALAANPFFSDTKAPKGVTVVYTITAVDKAGNESASSKPVEARLP